MPILTTQRCRMPCALTRANGYDRSFVFIRELWLGACRPVFAAGGVFIIAVVVS